MFYYLADPPLLPINTTNSCLYKSAVYNSTFHYQKSLCVASGIRNYTESRLNCLKNGMQLYNTNDLPWRIAEKELFKFANELSSAKIGNLLHIKGRSISECANINNTVGNFTKGFGSCSLLLPSICQFLEFPRKNLQCLTEQLLNFLF